MKTKLIITMLLLFGLLLTACHEEENSDFESGTMNENFEGDANPILEAEYKLTEEELENGVEPIELDDLIEEDIEDILEDIEEEEDEEDDDEGSPGPNI